LLRLTAGRLLPVKTGVAVGVLQTKPPRISFLHFSITSPPRIVSKEGQRMLCLSQILDAIFHPSLDFDLDGAIEQSEKKIARVNQLVSEMRKQTMKGDPPLHQPARQTESGSEA
jgi:hypothetical protein